MTLDDRDRLIEWLLVNGGPIVRYRTARELCGDLPAIELDRLERELLAVPRAQQELARLELGDLAPALEHLTPPGLARLSKLVHGSQPGALENVLGRLNELGLRAGMPDLDRRMAPLSRIFQCPEQTGTPWDIFWLRLIKSIFAWGLLRAGYRPDSAMQDYLCGHIETLHKIARDHLYDLYASGDALKGLPRAWAGKPILKPEIMAAYHLPLIHDLYVLAHLPAWMVDDDIGGKIDELIGYVIDPRFQSLRRGYGYAWIKERHACYAWGWSPHLVGFHDLNWQEPDPTGSLVQQMELMARFRAARESRWFQAALRYLEFFRTGEGAYCFPPHLLRDQPTGYYVSGACMGLGENRRTRRGLEIESTFHRARIRAAESGCFDRILL